MKKIAIYITISISLLVVSVFLTSFDSVKTVNQGGDYVYDFVDEMPVFPGGEEGLKKYIEDHLVYPKRLKKEGIGGRVFVSCIIEKDGEVTNEKAIQGFNKKLEFEALRVVQGMPNWIPGKHKGKLVRVRQTIAVEFK
ncbi:MAG TPA: energy transducer TonB [Crocinitomix sp.]|nr:energy transducer TonB [Crocinitomix sp.]